MILVDSREPINIASCMNPENVTRVLLPTGDYVFFSSKGEKVVIERKTPGDLITSFQTGRFQDQMKRIIEDADYPFLLIEGHLFATRDGFVKFGSQELRWRFTSIQSILMTAQFSGVYLVFSDNNEGTASMVENMFDYFQRDEHMSLMRPKVFKMFPDDMEATREAIVSMVPGIGPQLAKRLIDRFGTPMEVFLANPEDLQEVNGIGPTKVEKMIEVMFPTMTEEEIAELDRQEEERMKRDNELGLPFVQSDQ